MQFVSFRAAAQFVRSEFALRTRAVVCCPMEHDIEASRELRQIYNACVDNVLAMQELWKTWLYRETLESAEAMKQFAMADTRVPSRLWDLDPQLAHELTVHVANQLPMLHAMVKAIGDIQQSGLESRNTCVRLFNFYAYLPRILLNDAGVLVEPAGPERLTLPSDSFAPEQPNSPQR